MKEREAMGLFMMERNSRHGMPGTLILSWVEGIRILPMFLISFLKVIRI